ncbi:MAG: bifunctional DNA-formamidopyrimidine glycosylase/DNA-(apurinic or apyrimidinic site) lyase [Lachnospiraceae bacterium]
MPELPEVETIKRILTPQLCGRSIAELTINRPEVLAHPSPDIFCHSVQSAAIKELERHGKYLLIGLDNDCTIIIHLRMTGQLLCTPADYPPEKHTHVIFHLDNGQELRYIDVRRFGRLWLKRADSPDTFSGIHRLGIEAFDDRFNASYLQKTLGNRHITIKQGLLDQTVIAGLGNIYTDEALFAAKLNPCLPVSKMREQEWQALAIAILQVLEQAIANNNMTEEEYLAGGGKEYRNTPFFLIYGREGKGCPYCGTLIERVKIAGRSSFYCPKCQPKGVSANESVTRNL